MNRVKQQKIRLLALYDLLQSKTDEENPMSTQEIILALAECGISVTRKTLYQDFDLLNEYGYEVICVRGRSNRYFIGDRKFERPEVQMLLNAIGTTQTLSANKTEILVQKLLELLGAGEADQLRGVVPTNETKHSNERVYYSMDAITTAILKKKKLSFLYFDYGANGKREYRKNRWRYTVNPLGMAYSNNNLYLICYHDRYGDPAHYRIDRMDEVQVKKKGITQLEKYENFDLNAYRQELFDMYGGEKMDVELIFPQNLLEIAIDRFGEGITPISNGGGEYIVKTTVQVSITFFSWLTTFEGQVRIKSPQIVKEKYSNFIKKITETLK